MERKFDPMTGEPICTEQPNEQRQQGSDLENVRLQENKNNNKVIIIIIVAAAAVLLAFGSIIFAGFKSGAFLSKKSRILVAAANTFSDKSHLLQDLSTANSVMTDQYTLSVDGTFSDSYDRLSAKITLAVKNSDKQVYGYIDAPYVGDIDFVAELTKEEVRANIPLLTDDMLVYNYTEIPAGYITQAVDEQTWTMLNDSLAQIYSNEDVAEKASREILKVLRDEFKDIDVEKADKETFEVDGKDRKCRGYAMSITSDNVSNVAEEILDVYAEYYEDMLDAAGMSIDALYDELEYMGIDDMEDIDITFYIYKNKLAAICLDCDGEEIKWHFLGGARRTENMEMEVDGDVILEIKGTTKKTVETTKIMADGEKAAVIKYDYKTGELKIDAEDSAGINLEAILEADKRGLTIEVEDFTSYYDDISLDGTIIFSRDVQFQELTGDVFDIGGASEEDWMDMMENLYGAMGY